MPKGIAGYTKSKGNQKKRRHKPESRQRYLLNGLMNELGNNKKRLWTKCS